MVTDNYSKQTKNELYKGIKMFPVGRFSVSSCLAANRKNK